MTCHNCNVILDATTGHKVNDQLEHVCEPCFDEQNGNEQAFVGVHPVFQSIFKPYLKGA